MRVERAGEARDRAAERERGEAHAPGVDADAARRAFVFARGLDYGASANFVRESRTARATTASVAVDDRGVDVAGDAAEAFGAAGDASGCWR